METTLYLDLATETGVCVGHPGDHSAWTEDFSLSKTKINTEPWARRFTKFESFLAKILHQGIPDIPIRRVVVEKCFSRGKNDAPVGHGLQAILALFCDKNDIQIEYVEPKKLKKYISGNGNASKEFMAEMLHKRFGVTEFNNNIVDAVCLMMFDHKIKPKKLHNGDNAENGRG